MFDSYVPPNWFWILMAILLSCYLKLASDRNIAHSRPVISPASIVSIFWKV